MTTKIKEVENNPLTSDEIEAGIKALKLIGNSAKKQRGYYLEFGKIWWKVREECKGDKKKMGKIRMVTFSNAIDPQTASYSARMYELWEDGLKEFATLHRPKLNNPRPLVQDYLKHQKAIENQAEELRLKKIADTENANFKRKLAKLTPAEREKAQKAQLEEMKEALNAERKRKKAEEQKEAIDKIKKIAKSAEIALPKKLQEDKPKTATPTETVERFGGSLAKVIEVVNKRRITTNQIETVEKYIQSLKSAIAEYYADTKDDAKMKNVA